MPCASKLISSFVPVAPRPVKLKAREDRCHHVTRVGAGVLVAIADDFASSGSDCTLSPRVILIVFWATRLPHAACRRYCI